MREIGVGILGFGTVGAGTAEGLLRNGELLSRRLGVKVVLRRIADLDTTTDRGIALPEGMLVSDALSVINDPEIDIIVELIGGTGVARKFILAALDAGKSVVTANKKLLAEYGDEIFSKAEAKGVDIYFGAAVGGGIPIIRVLREGLAGNQIRAIDGILNGTCNYILTRMENEGLPFDEVLKAAQAAGFAEADPTLDIDGWDTAHKAAILASLAYGFHLPLSEMSVSGIRGLHGADVRYARELGYRIKLLAMIRQHGNQVEARVHPTLVPIGSMLGSVSNVFNAVLVNGDMSDQTLYYGRGAGRAPTASTVVGDIGDLARNIATGKPRYSRALAKKEGVLPTVRPEGECESRFYLRVQLKDEAGTFGKLTTILGAQGVNIRAASQREEPSDSSFVPVVVLTNAAREDAMARAVEQIKQASIAEGEPVLLRML
ncbi:MAG: homoserine dehydrogenase [Kiritimatiellia bacterium]